MLWNLYANANINETLNKEAKYNVWAKKKSIMINYSIQIASLSKTNQWLFRQAANFLPYKQIKSISNWEIVF